MDRKLTSGICVLISFSVAARAIPIVTTRHFAGTQTHHLTVGGLPEPYHTAGVSNGAQRAATPNNAVLNAPPDFEVSAVAEGFVSPCTLMAHPAGNGGLLVCESNAGRISFVRFRGGQEVERSTFVSGLSRPFGMATTPGYFYVGNTNSVVRYAFDGRQTVLSSAGEQIMTLQGGGHWTRNLEVSAL